MNELERQAIDKETEKDMWKRAIIEALKENRLSEQQLSLVIEKVYQLGHNAGHCRGELYSIGARSS